jgi:hypothetical protein
VTEIAHYIVAHRLDQIYLKEYDRPYNDALYRIVVYIFVDDVFGYRWVKKIAHRDNDSGEHIKDKQSKMRLVVFYESFYHALYPFL